MTQDAFVLLVTDSVDRTRLLARGIERVLPCRYATPDDRFPSDRPLLVVVDVDTERPENAACAEALIRRARTGGIACLHLSRDAKMSASRADAPLLRVMAAGAARATVFAAMLEMIDLGTRAWVARKRRLEARASKATGIVTRLFDTAGAGRPLSSAEADSGTEAVMEAVSDVGIRSWLDIVWKHDALVYQHTLSVAGFAAAFGAQIGLSGADRHRLAKAALLHDIGKSRIPVEILNKPGPLEGEEARIMRTHAALGADLLLAQGGFDPAVIDVVRHHHEKLDGSGYPDGLAGDAIADLVRIVTLCDIFSALTERRPYRPPMSATQAVSIMTGMRGQLDRSLMHGFAPVIAATQTEWA